MRHDYDPDRPNGAAIVAGVVVIGIIWGTGLLFAGAVIVGLVRFIGWAVTGS